MDRNGILDWVDIARDRDALKAHGLKRETAMQRLHVRDAQGRWQTGAWGFVELWGHLPGYRWLSQLIRYSGTSALLDRLYTPFARWRLRRRCTNECL
jgi:predicted DCC family thiol-disulfide oxidoreductase YuxK